jgi:hypothetical protein
MTEFKFSETRYAQREDISIAYQVVGDGPVDILVVPGLYRLRRVQPGPVRLLGLSCRRWRVPGRAHLTHESG